MSTTLQLHVAVCKYTGDVLAASTSRPGLAIEFSRLGWPLASKERAGEVVVHEVEAMVELPAFVAVAEVVL